MPSTVILYRYDGSPFSEKVDHVLLLKSVPHQTVHVSSTLPRPEITNLLGIGYRRIPILAIDNDIYCDTSLITSALERRFALATGYGTVFPPRKNTTSADTGLIKAFAKHYADSTLFPLAPAHLPWEKIPKPFIDDRSSFRGAPINVQGIVASRGKSMSELSAQLALIEEQLKDGREWLFDTEAPSLADVAVHFVYSWLRPMRNAHPLFNEAKFPTALKWLDRLSSRISEANKKNAPQRISGDEAAKLIASAPFEPYNVVGFDSTEAQRLGLQSGQTISVTPDDNGRNYPTVGKLVALNDEEICIEVKGSSGIFRCHFPRIGFTARATPSKL
ncbi:glutathione s-transferase [Moniliophthora roreri MCA 2997]|uniref:Glutathione s-transferase n=2 Tax=Moniliophthora roreri TaxID=221103 RepID=V2XV27_MONRO|nr:glutathione s-transferase [Moniliophthora roreri MCA 2997]